ncbi:hypothetical protein KIN20_025942 [Parelaphostrongylus tenuis]|uniref:Uncharacterized protein n=1 Tax=Parelaphostrongylus tenuis TaxID=148309 RepID=A0AAD5MVY8_PARTN|nr:hypothetical protein KIN20_025942 [Parelaphostrongylus tenuis]
MASGGSRIPASSCSETRALALHYRGAIGHHSFFNISKLAASHQPLTASSDSKLIASPSATSVADPYSCDYYAVDAVTEAEWPSDTLEDSSAHKEVDVMPYH